MAAEDIHALGGLYGFVTSYDADSGRTHLHIFANARHRHDASIESVKCEEHFDQDGNSFSPPQWEVKVDYEEEKLGGSKFTHGRKTREISSEVVDGERKVELFLTLSVERAQIGNSSGTEMIKVGQSEDFNALRVKRRAVNFDWEVATIPTPIS